MLFIDDEFKWEDEIKDSTIINWFYNLYNLGRYIKANISKYQKIEDSKLNHSIFKSKKKDTDLIDISQYINLDIVSSYHRKILSMFDVTQINSISDFLKVADEFADLYLFISKIGYDEINRCISELRVEEKNNKKIIKLDDISLEIELSVINKIGESNNVILDILESGKDKYITLYTFTIKRAIFKFISDENSKFNAEEKILLSYATDKLMKDMYTRICYYTGFTIVNSYERDDNELITSDLAKGKIYV